MALGRGGLAGPVSRQWTGPDKATLFEGRQRSGDWPSFPVAVVRARLSGLGGQGGWRRKVAAGKGVARSLGRAAAVAGPGVIGVSRAEQVSAFFTLET